jgi:hypothetical protein
MYLFSSIESFLNYNSLGSINAYFNIEDWKMKQIVYWMLHLGGWDFYFKKKMVSVTFK